MKSKPFHLQVASLSDPGKVRRINEDAVATDDTSGFAVVADGMGGHRAAEIASRITIRSMVPSLRDRPPEFPTDAREWIQGVVAKANAAINSAAQERADRKDMGATFALAVFLEHRVVLAHVGDSRIYRLRGAQFELMTRDDSLLNEQVEAGLIAPENAGGSHNRHLVTRALGIGKHVGVHVREEETRAGDVYLLCTDGLNDLVDDCDIELIVESLKTNLSLAATHLVQLANDFGGHDNITVALVRVLDAPRRATWKTWLGRLFGRSDA